IRKDGTLYPLLKGRADRAAAFYRRQKEATGKAPVLVPSGGQGSDEVMAEGEAVRRYLLSLGIPETDVLAETQSANTQENMKCSKALIDERKPDASVIFSTTNYHVFRSGILANDAGLHADGIASKTKWYFWPNAQIREYVGLLVRSRKLHAVLLLLLVVFSLLFSNLGAIISALIS
ncbi:MAG: YdcF family protein, partial [Clostridia bacterium]|nr:YdcF family protein [Clostridia bacterium]